MLLIISREDVVDQQFSDFLKLIWSKILKNVCVVLPQNLEGLGYMVLFKNAFVIISEPNFGQTSDFE